MDPRFSICLWNHYFYLDGLMDPRYFRARDPWLNP